jgi:hypothetical protein
MNPTEVKREMHLLPEGYEEVTWAKDQPEYIPLPSLVQKVPGTPQFAPRVNLITMWTPDANELELLKNGAPVCITLLYSPVPICPMRVEVGGTDAR